MPLPTPRFGSVCPNLGPYCDACGECLPCYGEDPCHASEDHLHIVPKPAGAEERRPHPECIACGDCVTCHPGESCIATESHEHIL